MLSNRTSVTTTSYGIGLTAKDHERFSSSNQIIDIRREKDEHSILEDIKRGLRPGDGQEKCLPTLLLYDEIGLKLFEKITYLDQYYLTGAEIEILEKYADQIAARVQPGSYVVELGSGNLRKVRILLLAFERAKKHIQYYALDLSLPELQRTLSEVPKGSFKFVQCFGLHGTYDDGLEWLKSSAMTGKPKCILSLGSSIGNFKRQEAPGFLENFSSVLGPGDSILVGLDGCQDAEKVFHAYNDKEDVTHQFIKNGLMHANLLLGYEGFNLDQWVVIGEYDAAMGRHHAFVSPLQDVTIDAVIIRQGEKVRIEESYKYSNLDVCRLWNASTLAEGAKWSNKLGDYALHMAYKPSFQFPVRPEEYAATPVPTMDEWSSLWSAWDTVTQQMIPHEELLSKPIMLRNACIFYLGHIPTFLAIHLQRATGTGLDGVEAFQKIFERGVDPDVENPEQCHAHSEIPDEWPAAADIIDFQGRVRDQVRSIYKQKAETQDALRRALWMSFEHEALHVETLLYMLIQSERTQPPRGIVRPDFEAMASDSKPTTNQWIDVPARDVTIGINDDENDLTTKRYFGWDNEKPPRNMAVPAFSAKARPITNGEYAEYMEVSGTKIMPASWALTSLPAENNANGHAGDINSSPFLKGKSVRTVFGQVPLEYALDWPVMASYDQLIGCASWLGGRIPTLEEVHSIYEYVDELKSKELGNKNGKQIPAVNSHLINDGVEETPPTHDSVNSSARSLLFVNLEGANVGFKHWHPTPVVQHGSQLSGRGEMGGVWEWTSTPLAKYEGSEPMSLYPNYTADFFDGKHNIVLGGSWASHPRVAGRKSFVNWYQRNYPYVWAGARVVRDL